jgi:colicin import membrane protein
LGELCWRDPSVWLSAETLARVAGLRVILDHPASLTATEYAARSVGSILFPYIAGRDGVENTDGPDLWGIGRVFLSPDQVAALPDMSTSPSVTFTGTDGNQMIELPDGQKCLVEASPSLIDHVAIVTDDAGVWDKGMPNSGIRADSTQGNHSMSDENNGGNIDLLMSRFNDALDKKLDPLTKRMDALEARKAEETKNDAKSRRGSERDLWEREDAAQCVRDDAAEQADIDRMRIAGEPQEVAEDKARKARKDAMAKRRADAARTRSAADAEADRKNESARADAQARADAVAATFGEQSPPPMSGELALDYRKRLLRRFQTHSPQFRDADLHAIADAVAFAGVESVIYADAVKASSSTKSSTPE